MENSNRKRTNKNINRPNQQNTESQNTERQKAKAKNKSMKLSIFKYKITLLFVVLTLILIGITVFYENKTNDFQLYLNGRPTEYITAEEAGVKQIQLGAIKSLDCFTYDNESEQKTTIIMPNDKFFIVDYITKTVTDNDTLEKVEAQVLGESIDDVIVSLDTLQEMGGFIVTVESKSKIVYVADEIEFSVSEKLAKQEKFSYFNPDLIEEYFSFMLKHSDLQSLDLIIAVNEGLYRPFYEDTEVINSPEAIDALVNKYYSLPSLYQPVDLVDKGDGRSLRQRAYRAFNEVSKELNKIGGELYLISAYRSYARQETLYNGYIEEYGQDYADISSARPGFSEHQTGLSMDILNVSGVSNSLEEANFQDSEEYAWLVDNAYKYGLILRYPKGLQGVTGYMYEPWHWRYVGEDVATFMHENQIETLEEFHALRGASAEKFPELSSRTDKGEALKQSFYLDENSVEILTYEIDGLNYYNVGDIARFTNETKYQYKVVFEESNGRVNLIKSIGAGIGKNYSEYSEKYRPYKVSEYEIAVDNFNVETIYNQYIFDEELYMSLVDLNKILGFDIEWNFEKNAFEF